VAIIHAQYRKTHLSQPSVLQWMHAVITGYCPETKAIVRKTSSADWPSSVAMWEVIGDANRKSATYTSALLIKLYRHMTSNISSCDWTQQHTSCDVLIPNKIASLELSHFSDKKIRWKLPERGLTLFSLADRETLTARLSDMLINSYGKNVLYHFVLLCVKMV